MLTAKLYNQKGEAKGEVKLNPVLFDVALNSDLLHQALTTIAANRRLVLAHAKTRGEVRGGGRKPWRQKGTGRARQGSIRSPLWRGGAVTFGPSKEANFSLKINKKMSRKAILMALSEKARGEQIAVLENFSLVEKKTKDMSTLFKKMGLKKSILLVAPKADLAASRPVRNLAGVSLLGADSLNVYDVLKYQTVVFFEDSFAVAEKTFGKK